MVSPTAEAYTEVVAKGKPFSKLKHMRDTSEKEAEEKTEQQREEELKEARRERFWHMRTRRWRA